MPNSLGNTEGNPAGPVESQTGQNRAEPGSPPANLTANLTALVAQLARLVEIMARAPDNVNALPLHPAPLSNLPGPRPTFAQEITGPGPADPGQRWPAPGPAKLDKPGPALVDVANEFLIAKARQRVSEAYLRQLRWGLHHFLAYCPEGPAALITARQIEDFISRAAWAPATRRNVLVDLQTFFGWARRRGLVDGNPAAAVDKPRLADRPPGIHTPAQVATVLEAARAADLDLCRLLAVQYFAGLRPAEAARLAESDILPKWIAVSAAKSKTRQRRLVAITPALASWLALGGQLPVKNRVRRWRAVRRAAGVAWPPDVTRHSFASYHLARWRSQDETAHQLGHRSTQMLFAHYRELVTPAAAVEFWAIRPKKAPPAGPGATVAETPTDKDIR